VVRAGGTGTALQPSGRALLPGRDRSAVLVAFAPEHAGQEVEIAVRKAPGHQLGLVDAVTLNVSEVSAVSGSVRDDPTGAPAAVSHSARGLPYLSRMAKRTIAGHPGGTARVTAAFVGALVLAGPVQAQEVTGATPSGDSLVPVDSAGATDSVPPGPSPSGAFLRGALIPGWGHAASGSLTRGAFYFGFEAAAGWMVFKTWRRLRVARELAAVWEERVTAQLERDGITDPAEIETELGRHEDVVRARGLVDSREEQREDWVAVTVFALLMSGVDAFVSAHLQDFPDPLTVEGSPDGTIEVAIRVPVG